MTAPAFFSKPEPMTIASLAEATGARLADGADGSVVVSSVAPLDAARAGDLTFLENTAYVVQAASTEASACYIAPKFVEKLRPGVIPLISNEPYRAYAKAAALLFPASMKPTSMFGTSGIAPGSFIHPTAHLEEDVTVDPGAVIGPGAEIGARSFIGAGAVIGPQVRIGRGASVGPGATIQNALIGNRVILHPGVRIGQDGFGFAMGATHLKVPQLGRVIIQDDVEIGANATIDRGATRDTVIGEGTKIDNLVQIAHNVTVGRHCVIVAQVGISGSTTLEDYVVVAGQAGITGHLRIGMGAQIGAQSGVMTDVEPGARYLGSPAKPARQAMREVAALAKLIGRGKS
ncbi:MAG: UDP-3-O-(3-hydroxymyristoyl)glucosamine N-acyltransferase [Proteobacteria bacterium]|nr:UDP-3-O-(3-hydroxymyristoyl)glucosamine N-acyltransferase [Pseudomonadota bacterium]